MKDSDGERANKSAQSGEIDLEGEGAVLEFLALNFLRQQTMTSQVVYQSPPVLVILLVQRRRKMQQ